MKIKSNNNINTNIAAQVNYVPRSYSGNGKKTNFPSYSQNGFHSLDGFGKKVDLTGTLLANSSTGAAYNDIANIEKNIQEFLNIRDNKSPIKYVRTFDLETLGSDIINKFTGEASPTSEKNMFSIIEAAYNDVYWENGEAIIKDKKNFIFGINSTQEEEIYTLIKNFSKGEAISSADRSTLSTMAKYGVSLEINDGGYTYRPPSSFDKNSVADMKAGVEKLRKLGKLGYTYDNPGTIGFKQLGEYTEAIRTADALIGQNSKGFDIPHVAKTYEKITGSKYVPKGGQIHLDTFEAMDIINIDMSKAFPDSFSRGFRKLENLAKLPGFAKGDFLAHTADFDIMSTIHLLDIEVEGLNNSTIMEHVLDKVKNIREKAIGMNVQSKSQKNPTFVARNSLSFKGVDGSVVSNRSKTKTLDHITESFISPVTNEPLEFVNTNKESLFKQGNVYEMLDTRKITLEEIISEIQYLDSQEISTDSMNLKEIAEHMLAEDLDEMYVAEFLNKTSYNKEKSYLIRSSKEELLKTIDGNLGLTDMSDQTIKKERRIINAKQAERTIDDYFNPHVLGKGANNLENDLDSFNRLKRAFYKENIEFSRDSLKELIRNSSIKSRDGRDVKYMDVFFAAGLHNPDNVTDIPFSTTKVSASYDTKRIKTILNGFNFYQNNGGFYGELIDTINSMENVTSNYDRTVLINTAKEEFLKLVEEKGGVISNDFVSNEYISKTNMLGIDFKGETHHLNLSSQRSMEQSINRLASKSVKGTTKAKDSARKVENMWEIAKDLKKKKIISKTSYDKIRTIKDPFNLAKAITSELSGTLESHMNLSDYEKSNLSKAATTRETNIKKLVTELKNTDKSEVEKIKEIKSKLKVESEKLDSIKFAKKYTGVKDMQELDYIKGKFDIVMPNGERISYMDFAKKHGFIGKNEKERSGSLAYKIIQDKVSGKTGGEITGRSFINIKDATSFKGEDATNVLNFFNKELGMSSVEAEDFSNAIFGRSGFLSKQKNGADLGITFVTQTNDKNMKTAKMIISANTNHKLVNEEIINNTFHLNPNLAVIDLPEIRTIGTRELNGFTKGAMTDDMPIRVIGKNGNRRVVEEFISTFYKTSYNTDKKGIAEIGRLLNYGTRSSVNDVFSIFRYDNKGYSDIFDMLGRGQGHMVSKNINKKINKQLNELKPISGGGYFKTGDGGYTFRTIANKADYSSFYGTKITGLVDLMPALWVEQDGSSNFRKHMYELFKKNGYNASETDDFFSSWLNFVTDKTIPGEDRTRKYGKTYGKAGLLGEIPGFESKIKDGSFLFEDIVLNQNSGLGYLTALRDSDLIKYADSNLIDSISRKGGVFEKVKMQNVDLAEDINQLIKNFSQAISEKHVSGGYGSTMPVFTQQLFGDIQDLSRPVSHQNGINQLIDLGGLSDKEIKAALDSGIILGTSAEQRPIDIKASKYNKAIKYKGLAPVNSEGLKLVDGLTINTRMINGEGITSSVEAVREEFAKNTERSKRIENAIWEALYGDKDRIKGSVEEKHLKEVIEKNLTDFSHRGTNEQKSQMSPMASMLLEKDHFKEVRTDNLSKVLAKDGDILRNGTPIGIDMNGKVISYSGREGKVIGSRNGKLSLKMIDVPSTDQKYMSGSEKTVFSVSKYDSFEERKAAQILWEESFGKDVHSLSNHETIKHKSANFAHEKLVDSIVYAKRDGSDEAIDYMRTKLMNIYTGDVGDSVADFVKTYEGSVMETGTFILPSNNIINPDDYFGPVEGLVNDNALGEDELAKRKNIVKAYKDTLDSIVEDSKVAYQKGIDGRELVGAEKFLSKFYKESIINGDKDVVRHSIALTRVEDVFSVGSDAFTFSDDVVAQKTGKIGYKDLFWLGRHAGLSDESRAMFYDLDGNGKVIKAMGDVAREHYLNEMYSTSEFLSNAKDMQGMVNSTILMAQDTVDYSVASAEEMLAMEKKLGLDKDIHRITLDDVMLSGDSTTPEQIKDTIFGVAGDKKIIRIDLEESNLLIHNPATDYKIKSANHVDGYYESTKGSTKYIYMANTNNEYIRTIDGEEVFMASEYQKEASNFLNNLQQTNSHEEGALKAQEYAESSLAKMYAESLKTLNEKDGLVIGKLLNQRVKYSGMSLYSEIIEEGFSDDFKHNKRLFGKNMTIDLGPYRKGGGKGVIDVKYVSEKHFNELTGGNGVEDIGYQLMHNDFDSNERFRELAKRKGYVSKNGDILLDKSKDSYRKLGRAFLETEGAQGVDVRYPSFNPNTQVATMIRLKPEEIEYSIKTDGSIIHEHTALKLNADTDGDTGMTVLWGRRGDNGRFEMFDSGSELRVAHQRMIVGQSLDTQDLWLPMARERKAKMAKKEHMITAESYARSMKELSEDGFIVGGDNAFKAYKAKYDKISIGPVSNANYYMNDLAYYGFSQLGETTEFNKFKDVFDFTAWTEQKIISAKLTSSKDNAQIGKAKRYQQALSWYGKDVRRGVSETQQILEDMNLLDFASFDEFHEGNGINKLMNVSREAREIAIDDFIGSTTLDDPSTTKKALMGIGTLAELHSKDEILTLNDDYLFKHTAIKDKDIAKVARAIQERDYNKDSFKNKLKDELIHLDTDKLEKVQNLNTQRQSLSRLTESDFIDSSGNKHSVLEQTYFVDRNGSDKTIAYMTKNSDGEITTNYITGGRRMLEDTENTVIKDLMNKGIVKFDDVDTSLLTTAELGEANFAKRYIEELHSSKILNNEEYLAANNKVHEAIIERAKREQITRSGGAYTNPDVNAIYPEKNLRANLNDIVNYSYQDATARIVEEGGTYKLPKTLRGDTFDVGVDSFIGSKRTPRYTARQRNVDFSLAADFSRELEFRPIDSNELANTIKTKIYDQIDEFSNEARESTIGLEKYIDVDSTKYKERLITNTNNAANIKALNLIETRDINFNAKVLENYNKNSDALIEAMNWGESVTISNNTDDYLSNIRRLGKAKVYKGKFAGVTAKEMDLTQLNKTIESMKSYVLNSKTASEASVATINHDALVRYRESISAAAIANETLNDLSIENSVFEAMNISSIEFEDTAKAFDSSGIDIGSELKKNHEKMIKYAKSERKAFNNTIDGMMSQKGAASKLLLAGVGAAVAGTMMAGTLGIAGRLDPNSKNGFLPEDEGVVIRKASPKARNTINGGNLHMEKRSHNITSNSTNGINNSNILDALKVNYSGTPVRINVTNEGYDDNNNKWLDREISRYL